MKCAHTVDVCAGIVDGCLLHFPYHISVYVETKVVTECW